MAVRATNIGLYSFCILNQYYRNTTVDTCGYCSTNALLLTNSWSKCSHSRWVSVTAQRVVVLDIVMKGSVHCTEWWDCAARNGTATRVNWLSLQECTQLAARWSRYIVCKPASLCEVINIAVVPCHCTRLEVCYSTRHLDILAFNKITFSDYSPFELLGTSPVLLRPLYL